MNTRTQQIHEEVLKKIVPTEQQRKHLMNTIANLKTSIIKEIIKTQLPVTCELVGSTAKDTYLATSLDIDLFLMFPTSTSREQLETIGLEIGRTILSKKEEGYAEHPYVRGYYNEYKTEIVPCYKIESATQKLSAVDRTPLHTKYIQAHITEQQKNQVRLLKQFLKGIDCYGAEAAIEGFSGYLCELLILKYDTFDNLIKNAQQWNYGEILALTKGEYQCFDTPLVFIDPVDTNRNVASALSHEQFNRFIEACKGYEEKPQITFFFPNPVQPWNLTKITDKITNNQFIGISIQKPDIIEENLYPQVRKALKALTNLCEQYDFKITDSNYFITDSMIFFVLKPQTLTLSETVVHQGPPTNLKEHVNDFVTKWKNNPKTVVQPYEKNNRYYVEIKRDYRTLPELIYNQISTLSLGRHLDPMVKKHLQIYEKSDLMNEKLRVFWTLWLDPKKPWER